MIYVVSITKSGSEGNPSPLSLAQPSAQETPVIRNANPGSSREYGTPIRFDVSQFPLQMTRRKCHSKATIHQVELHARVSHSQNHPARLLTGFDTESDTCVAMTP